MTQIGNSTYSNDEEYRNLFSGRKLDRALSDYIKHRVLRAIIESTKKIASGSKNVETNQKALMAVIYSYSSSKSYYSAKGYMKGKGGFKAVALTSQLEGLFARIETKELPDMKAGKGTNVIINNVSVTFASIARLFNNLLIEFGIYIEIPNHALAVKRLLTLLSLFNYRLKNVFYQDKGNTIRKNAEDDEGGLIRFRQYGLTKDFYSHFKYMNLPPETKSTIRGATGIGTDMIDYYEMARRSFNHQSDKFEKTKIENFFRRKLAFLGNDVCSAILEEVENLGRKDKEPAKIIEITMATATLGGVRYDHYFVMPIIAYYDVDCTVIDFTAQGAYLCYQKLKSLCDGNEITTNVHCNDTSYAFIIAMFDLILADQEIVSFMFATRSQRRGDLGKKVIKLDVPVFLSLPALLKWSKSYNGEMGDTSKNEQKTVNIVMAGKQYYNSNDFMNYSTYKTKIVDVYDTLAGVMQNQRFKTIQGTVEFGTQRFHQVSQLEKKGVIPDGIDFRANKVIPFFSGPSVETIQPSTNNGENSMEIGEPSADGALGHDPKKIKLLH